jgi:hypothetical protein
MCGNANQESGALDFSGFQTNGTDMQSFSGALDQALDSLDVGFPDSFGFNI